jgi:hypothetical protein
MSVTPESAPEPDTTEAPAPRRVRWVLRLGAAAVIGVMCYAGWAFFQRELAAAGGARQLAAARADADADDPNWTWERLNEARPLPPRGKNGAPLIPEIKRLTSPSWGKTLADPEFNPRLDIAPNVRYSPSVMEVVRRELTASAGAVGYARALKDRPFGYTAIELGPNVVDTLLPHVQANREVADLLKWECVVAVEDADDARTADGLLALLNASRAVGDEPFLISQLVRMAVRAIAVRTAERAVAHRTDLALADLHAALAADAEDPLLLYGYRGERATTDRMMERVQTGAIDFDKLLGSVGTPTKRPWWRIVGPSRAGATAVRAELLNHLNWCVGVARLPVHEQAARVAAAPPVSADPDGVSLKLAGGVDKLAQAHWRSVAEARCAVAGVACERFRQERGRWPNDLNELLPKFLAAVPLDPYGGAPLRYAKLDDGVVVSSAGKGPSRVEPGPSRPGLPEGIDFGFRLWNPDRRHLPPPPDPPRVEDRPAP